MKKTISHTSCLIKDNIATILTEFPNAFIRPMNKYEPKNATTQNHRRVDHLYAHIAITDFEVQPNGFKKAKPEEFYYVTSSTYFTLEKQRYVSFRWDLVEKWVKAGAMPNIIWFVKPFSNRASKMEYTIVDGSSLRNSYIRCLNNKKTVRYNVDGYEYFAWDPFFYCDEKKNNEAHKSFKNRAMAIPEKTYFDAKYVDTFDWIENVTYSSHRCRKDTVYGILKIDDPTTGTFEIKRKAYRSVKEFYLLNSAQLDCTEKTVHRRIAGKALQKLMMPLYTGYILYATYDENEFNLSDNEIAQIFEQKLKKVEVKEPLTQERTVVIDLKNENETTDDPDFVEFVDKTFDKDTVDVNIDTSLVVEEDDNGNYKIIDIDDAITNSNFDENSILDEWNMTKQSKLTIEDNILDLALF